MRPILFACLLIAGAAIAAPDIVTRIVAGQADWQGAGPAGGAAPAGAAAQVAGPIARDVEVQAAADGHFYVEADINFRPVRLLVDTGATVVALRQSDAHAAGIRPLGSDFKHPVQTANGIAYAAATELDSIAVRDIEVRHVPALILPDDQLAISLLGGSFLNRLARFQVAGGRLIFEN